MFLPVVPEELMRQRQWTVSLRHKFQLPAVCLQAQLCRPSKRVTLKRMGIVSSRLAAATRGVLDSDSASLRSLDKLAATVQTIVLRGAVGGATGASVEV